MELACYWKHECKGTWVIESVKHPTLGFSSGHGLMSHDLMGLEIEPCVRLHTQQGVCMKILSLCSSPHSLSLPLSKINKPLKKRM